MELTKEEFDEKFVETLDTLLASMAEAPEIDVKNFYTMACILENLRYFSPVLFGVLQNTKK